MECCSVTSILGLSFVGYALYRLIKFKFFPARPSPYKADWKKDVVYLYQFDRSSVCPSMSPYCLKLETWLRMAGVKYENVENLPFSMRSKEGTLPFVEVNGVEYPDSSLAIRDLKRIFHKEAIDEHEDTVCLGVARAALSMTEGTLVSSYAYSRFVDHTKEALSAKVLPKMPTFVNMMLPFYMPFIPAMFKKRLVAQGIGKHTPIEIRNIGLDDLKALSQILGDKKYFLGGSDKPSSVDAGIFGTLGQILYIPIDTPHVIFMRKECKNLIEFCDRIKDQYWPDWKEATEGPTLNTTWVKITDKYLTSKIKK